MRIRGTLKWACAPLNHPGFDLDGPAAILVGGDVYVHGGFGTKRFPFYKFSLATRQWTSIGGCAYRYSHSCVLVDDKIYIVGGARAGTINLPIEAFNLPSGVTEEFEPCITFKELAVFVESQRQIVILGRLSGGRTLETFGFDVDGKRLSMYRVTAGDRRPNLSHGASVVECNQRVFFMWRPSKDRSSISVLTIVTRKTAHWAELKLNGDTLPTVRLNALEVVDGLILCFGGRTTGNDNSTHACFIHPLTHEVTGVGVGSSIQHVGNVPAASYEMGSASTQNKLWLFGAMHGKSIVEAEFCRE